MRKAIIVITAILLPLVLFATARVVVVEVFTGTWCPYCPGAARGVDGLVDDHPGGILAVEYHGGDVFENTEAGTRQSYYGSVVSGYPTAIFDGLLAVVGGSSSGSMLFYYTPKYNQRVAIESPLSISLAKDADFLSTGTLTATITNTSSAEVSGTVHFTVTESHIPYKWQTMDTLDFVERAMLPNASGEAITLAPGEKKILTRNYNIDASWPSFTKDDNIEFGCFVQGSSKEIYQAGVLKFSAIDVEEENPGPFAVTVPGIISEQGTVNLILEADCALRLALYDSTGRLVKTLHQGALSAGQHSVAIDARDLANGTYFLTLTSPSHTEQHKLVVTH